MAQTTPDASFGPVFVIAAAAAVVAAAAGVGVMWWALAHVV